MRTINLNEYIFFGSSVRFILDAHSDLPIKGEQPNETHSLMFHLNRVLQSCGGMGLVVSERAAKDQLRPFQTRFEKLDEDALLSHEDAQAISEAMRKVAYVLKNEIASLQALLVSEKRLPTGKLLSDVGKLFARDVYDVLPDIAQYDFKQAGKCIALNIPTAAAFHALRGTESVLRSYYHALTGSVSSNITWGEIEKKLTKITTEPPPSELLGNLSHIRISFRNPTAHPEKQYDIDEAQDLFNLCADAVNRMAKDLFERDLWERPGDF